MSRKTAREQVYKLIYERCVNGVCDDFSLELCIGEMPSEDEIFVRKLYNGVNEKYDFLKGAIEKYSKNFVFDRIFKLDCALILVAAYEILYLDDIPVGASINEALEFAKKYSTDKSQSFINGVLASVVANKEELLNEQE